MLVSKMVLKGTFEKHAVPLNKTLCPLNLDKLIFHNLPNMSVWGMNRKIKRYRALYYKKINAVLMHMYCNSKMDTTEGFRSELSQFMS